MIVTIDGNKYYQPEPEEYDIPVEVINNKLKEQGYQLLYLDVEKRLFLLEEI